MQHIRPLFEGPVDVVGDVHGEIDALLALMRTLGYDAQGEHPQGRRLVFVGDLTDRGPDSPAVLELVMSMVQRQVAQCLLGNHELNLLRGSNKAGNAWLLDPLRTEQQPGGEFAHSQVANPASVEGYLRFMSSLPLVLERDDLRVVHAAWLQDTITALRNARGTVLQTYQHHEQLTLQQLSQDGVDQRASSEQHHYSAALHDRDTQMALLPALAERDERHQMGNPVRVVTSGVERRTAKPFWSSGQWRMCDRVPWWNEYVDAQAVIMGHYWRQLRPIAGSSHAASKPSLFGDAQPSDWLGPRRNVFCVDFSVGRRYEERKSGKRTFDTRLCAMRWPERLLIAEDGLVS